MHIVTPYKGIDKILLNQSREAIESNFDKTWIIDESKTRADDYLNVYYDQIVSHPGISSHFTISYKNNLSCFIGVSGNTVYNNFVFVDKNFDDILNYFTLFPARIFIEDEVSICSEHLGIGAYFEDDCLQEVSVFTREYFLECIENMIEYKV